jgi:hypothetical protein
MDMAHLGGYSQRRFRSDHLGDILHAAFSTQNATDILNNVANKVLRDAFMSVDQAWREVAAVRNVSDFKESEHYRLTMDAEFEQVGPGGELPHASSDDDKYTTQANTYGKIFVITRQDIINDDLGAFNDVRRLLGRGGAQALNNAFWDMVNSATFDLTQQNGNDLTYDNLADARQDFVEQTDSNGNYIGIDPSILMVHGALDIEARRLMNGTQIVDTASDEVPNRHPLQGAFTPVSSPYIDNVNSTELPWRLLADPNDFPAYVVSFLNGRQEPTIESADADFNTLGIKLRGYYDFGCDQAEDQAGVTYSEATS